jgi:hypothetical protein
MVADVQTLRWCAYCGRGAQGQYSIHRDGFGVGPEVDLCNACGSRVTPTCGEIWSRIARAAIADHGAKEGE